MSLVNLLTKVFCVQCIFFWLHFLYSSVRGYVLDNTYICGNALIRETVGIALVLSGQKGKYVRPQYVGRDDQCGLAFCSYLDLLVGGKDLIQIESVGFRHFFVAFGVKMETILLLYVLDSLRQVESNCLSCFFVPMNIIADICFIVRTIGLYPMFEGIAEFR